jgi:ferritin-like metal-binding protein YciE
MATKERALDDLFEETLKDIFYAENKILKTLPKMAPKGLEPISKLRMAVDHL